MILLCPILDRAAGGAVSERAADFREGPTYDFLGGAITTFVGAVASEYGGKSFEAVIVRDGRRDTAAVGRICGLAAAVLLL